MKDISNQSTVTVFDNIVKRESFSFLGVDFSPCPQDYSYSLPH